MGNKLSGLLASLAFAMAIIVTSGCQVSTFEAMAPLPKSEQEHPESGSPLMSADLRNAARTCSEDSLKVGRYKVGVADPCQSGGKDNHLLYIFNHRTMYVCENGVTQWANFVSGGRGGFMKTRQGDKKVPQGIYDIGQPRPSENYGIFIPILYPNVKDTAAGRTGGSVGIHGPKRVDACDGSANLFTPWTDGCIAYPSDAHVYEVARWLSKNPKAFIELRAQ